MSEPVQGTTERQRSQKPSALFAMNARSLAELFGPQEWELIDSTVELIQREPLTDFSDVPEAELAEVEVLITGWGVPTIGESELARMPRLRHIVHSAGTVKTFLTPHAFERGIRVSSAAVANAIPVAEYTLACVIMGLKRASRMQHQLREGTVYQDLSGIPFIGAFGPQIGVVGASLVGRKVIELLAVLDVSVVVYDPYLSDADAADLGVTSVSLDKLCRTSHVVSVHAPATPATRLMFGPAQFEQMRPGTIFINTARGSLVDHEALEHAALLGRIDAYLDVTEPEPLPLSSPLYSLPNVVLTPHIAGALGNEVQRLGVLASEELRRIAAGEPLRFPVRGDDLSKMA